MISTVLMSSTPFNRVDDYYGGRRQDYLPCGVRNTLLRGLADRRLAPAIRQMHDHVARPWTVALLARSAALSRSAFFERFARTVGLPPMEYLLAWRMAIAKDLLRREDVSVGEVAERVGYGSASTFSTAFSRHVGQPPSRYAAGTSAPARTPVRRR